MLCTLSRPPSRRYKSWQECHQCLTASFVLAVMSLEFISGRCRLFLHIHPGIQDTTAMIGVFPRKPRKGVGPCNVTTIGDLNIAAPTRVLVVWKEATSLAFTLLQAPAPLPPSTKSGLVVGRPSQSRGVPSNGLCCLAATEGAAESYLGTVCTHCVGITGAGTCRQGFICHGCLPLPYASQQQFFPKYWMKSNEAEMWRQ